jgi:hypothetical protein
MRKSEIVVVPNWGGRDDGKHFLITEWDAFRAEKWAWRAFIVLKGTTAQIPLDIARLGMVGVAIRAINAVLAADVDETKLIPLLDEMWTCVQMVRDPSTKVATPLVGTDDVEEIRTVGWLRSEVARLHTSFSASEALSELISALERSNPPEDSSTT